MKRSEHKRIKKQIKKLQDRAYHAECQLDYTLAERLQHEIKILELALGEMVYPYYV